MPPLAEIFPENAELIEQITRQDRALARELLERFTKPPPTREPWHWVIAQVYIKTPTVSGPFEPTGREYMRELINNINDDTVAEETACMGTGAGKTTINICQALWAFEHDPFSGLYVMPAKDGEGGARHFNNGSMIPSIENTEIFKARIPTGADRHNFSGLHLEFAGNNLGFVGANSPTQLGAKRCRVIFLDEQDKYKEKLGREAGADYLANERTKQVPNKKVLRKSTPTRENAGIWPHLMRSDLRRRFLPCPHCNPSPTSMFSVQCSAFDVSDASLKGWFLLINSPDYTVLPGKFENGTALPAAALKWDKEARRKDKTWDIDRVIRSTRFECPHCGGHIRDHHRLWLDKHGHWLPTRTALLHKGYHLSSYYTPHVDFDSSWGGMAKKFLDKYEDGSIGGYINSDLAEVHTAQEHGGSKIQINSIPLSQPDWVPLLTADFHKNHPYIWFVVRKWCAFKLLPPFPITNGMPDFVPLLLEPGNEGPREKCEKLLACSGESMTAAKFSPVWAVIAELMRFDSRTGSSPVIEFLLAQKIVGEKLVKFYRETANADTLEFRRAIYREMSPPGATGHPIIPPRGGDSELVAAGHCDLSGEACWEELADIVKEFQIGKGLPIPERCVAIDCGFAEKFNRTVLQKCYETATEFKWYDPLVKTKEPVFFTHARHAACQRAPVNGWQAIRGKPTFRPLGGGAIARDIGLHVEDPYYATPNGGTSVVDVLEIPTDLFWVKTQDLRDRKTKQSYGQSPHTSFFPKRYLPDGTRTEESKIKAEDYERQINEQIFDEAKNVIRPRHGRGGMQSRMHPYHLGDCETYQTALAAHLEFFEQTSTRSGK